jgi:hypothetical protein
MQNARARSDGVSPAAKRRRMSSFRLGGFIIRLKLPKISNHSTISGNDRRKNSSPVETKVNQLKNEASKLALFHRLLQSD